jgi:hypothetical protein
LAVLAVVAILCSAALGAGRFLTIHRALYAARRDVLEGRADNALKRTERALADNRVLKWGGVQ